MKVLVIGDNEEVVDNLSLCLGLVWPQVNIIATAGGGNGVDLVETESPDIVILDLELPDIDGFKVLEQLRSFSDVPIIILTTREAEMDKARGLEMGADDYITRPFSPIDLMARVKAVLRRATMPHLVENHSSMFITGNLAINFATHDVFVSGEPVNLTPTEYNLLCNLVKNSGQVLSRRFLLEKTWGSDYIDDTTSLKKYIYRLRVKLGDNQSSQPMLVTQRGIGYKFVTSR